MEMHSISDIMNLVAPYSVVEIPKYKIFSSWAGLSYSSAILKIAMQLLLEDIP